MLNFMLSNTGNISATTTHMEISNNYETTYSNYYDEGWGQHIAIDNDYNGNKFINRNRKRNISASSDVSEFSSEFSTTKSTASSTTSSVNISLKEYLNNLEDDFIPDIEPVVVNFVPRIRNPNELEIIYHAKLPIIVKAALYLYKFACYCSGYN